MKGAAFRKADLLLIAVLLIAALLLLTLPKSGGCGAVVEEGGTETYRIDLDALTGEQEIEIGGSYQVKLLAGPGYIKFLSSGCPDQVCVRTGKLTKAGQAAVCLPAKVSVRLEGKEREFDGYTG